MKRLFIYRFASSGSPADKAGLCVDDEVISMNDEKIEHMTFEQVRKILKDRNLRGSIKMLVKTYEGRISFLVFNSSILNRSSQMPLMILLLLLLLLHKSSLLDLLLNIVEHHHHKNLSSVLR